MLGKYKIPKTQHFSGSKQYHNSHQIGIAHMIFAFFCCDVYIVDDVLVAQEVQVLYDIDVD